MNRTQSVKTTNFDILISLRTQSDNSLQAGWGLCISPIMIIEQKPP